MKLASWFALTAGLLAGCSGTPETRYLLLSATHHRTASGGVRASRLTLATVRMPGLLDRPQLVQATSDNTLAVREYDRWAEPLDQMVARVLRENLALQPAQAESDRSRVRRITVDITEFMAVAGGTARLEGSWQSFSDNDGAALGPTHSFRFSISTDTSDSAKVAASLSQLLANLTIEIAHFG